VYIAIDLELNDGVIDVGTEGGRIFWEIFDAMDAAGEPVGAQVSAMRYYGTDAVMADPAIAIPDELRHIQWGNTA
jgi:hypothetical protein